MRLIKNNIFILPLRGQCWIFTNFPKPKARLVAFVCSIKFVKCINNVKQIILYNFNASEGICFTMICPKYWKNQLYLYVVCINNNLNYVLILFIYKIEIKEIKYEEIIEKLINWNQRNLHLNAYYTICIWDILFFVCFCFTCFYFVSISIKISN